MYRESGFYLAICLALVCHGQPASPPPHKDFVTVPALVENKSKTSVISARSGYWFLAADASRSTGEPK